MVNDIENRAPLLLDRGSVGATGEYVGAGVGDWVGDCVGEYVDGVFVGTYVGDIVILVGLIVGCGDGDGVPPNIGTPLHRYSLKVLLN